MLKFAACRNARFYTEWDLISNYEDAKLQTLLRKEAKDYFFDSQCVVLPEIKDGQPVKFLMLGKNAVFRFEIDKKWESIKVAMESNEGHAIFLKNSILP